MSAPVDLVPSDLDALRRTEATAGRPPRVGSLARWTLVLLALGVLGALVVVLEPFVFPPREVRLAAVRAAAPGETRLRSGVEAAGWIEAEPFPVTVRPLVTGVVTALPLLEGQRVVKDETLVARLRSAEIENALEVAQATHLLREAEVRQAQAALEADRAVLAQRLEARLELARLEGELATARATATAADEARSRAEAARETAALDREALRELEDAGSITPLALRRAEARLVEAEAAVRAARADVARAQADVARLDALVPLAREGVAAPRLLEAEVVRDEQALRQAEAARALAETEVRVAQRNVDHLTVRAPVDGVVLRLETAPGSVAGPEGSAREQAEAGTGSTGRLGAMSGALVSLYDPAHLQARVDILLPDVGGIGAGTDVEIEAEALAGRVFRGVVIRLQHEADLLKNALQVKVRILEPDPMLRPEMLVRARFRAKTSAGGEASPAPRVLVPAEAVRGEEVYVFDPRGGGRARRVLVRVVDRREGLVEVEGPLGPGHKVILDPVRDGERVRERR